MTDFTTPDDGHNDSPLDTSLDTSPPDTFDFAAELGEVFSGAILDLDLDSGAATGRTAAAA